MSQPIDSTRYLPASDYIQPIKTLNHFSRLIAMSIGEHGQGMRGLVTRNFVSRGIGCLESISQVWQLGNYQDCWTLHRTLVERLFTLSSLDATDEFDLFEKWSYVRQYESKNRILSDPIISKKLLQTEKSFSDQETERYREIKQENISWKRPVAKDVAKEMNLPFLYSLGYDFGSTHIHPMANDGEDDFLRLVDETHEPHFNQIAVLHNSIIIQLLLVQAGMKSSRLLWRGLPQDFLSDFISLLETGSQDYLTTCSRVEEMFLIMDLCRPTKME